MGEMKGTEVFLPKLLFILVYVSSSPKVTEIYHSCRYLFFSSFDSFVLKEAGFICMKLFRGTPRIFEYC